MSLAHDNPPSTDDNGPYRVMVVDDSAVIRGLMARLLEHDPSIRVIASASNGEQAINSLARNDVEVIVLDVEMPVMDGITALPKLLAINPRIKVIMASTLTQRNAQISLQALAAGATDYIPKPTASRDINQSESFQRELREKIKVLGRAYRTMSRPALRKIGARPSVTSTTPRPDRGAERGRIALRSGAGKPAALLAIGSSTGGPQALLSLLKDLDRSIQVPVLITQHMPPTFTTILAEHLARASGRSCAEAKDGEPVVAGRLYVAPGDWHMTVRREGRGTVIRLNHEAPVNYCRPAVDPMLQSVARVYDGSVLAVILTGMGQDGLAGSKSLIEAGGTVIAQDEESSVVWGMPGAVATAGLCSGIMSVPELRDFIRGFPKRLGA